MIDLDEMVRREWQRVRGAKPGNWAPVTIEERDELVRLARIGQAVEQYGGVFHGEPSRKVSFRLGFDSTHPEADL